MDIILFWKFEILENTSPFCKFPQKKWVRKNPRSWNNYHTPNLFKQPLSCCFEVNGKIGHEKFIWTPWISAQLPETFDLLWFMQFENPVFRAQSQRGEIPDFRRRRRANSQIPTWPLSQRTQGWNTSARESLAIDEILHRTNFASFCFHFKWWYRGIQISSLKSCNMQEIKICRHGCLGFCYVLMHFT